MPANSMELMICAAARLLEDGSTVAVGTGALRRGDAGRRRRPRHG